MEVLNGSKNRDLTVAMKAARDFHVRSVKPKADAMFVNTLEKRLLLINEEGTVSETTWMWQVIPVIGAAALVTMFSWRILKPSRDIRYEKKEGETLQSYILEEPGADWRRALTPIQKFGTVSETTVSAASVTSSPSSLAPR